MKFTYKVIFIGREVREKNGAGYEKHIVLLVYILQFISIVGIQNTKIKGEEEK